MNRARRERTGIRAWTHQHKAITVVTLVVAWVIFMTFLEPHVAAQLHHYGF